MIDVLVLTVIALPAILWIWALVDIFRSRFENAAMKFLWIVVIFLFPVLGAIVYFQIGRKNIAGSRRFNPDFRTVSK